MPEIQESSPIEESRRFTPRFDAEGLIPCITVDASNGDVLMFAWMNGESLRKTLETGFVHYWSRSRQGIWKKGETSGSTQRVVEIRTDCDQDVLLVRAAVADRSGTCHTGRASCFYRSVPLGGGSIERELTSAEDGEPRGDATGG
jgi:phosphoribosyl-AMP cyclohydrolase